MIVRELIYVMLVPFVMAACVALACRRWRNPSQIVWAVGVGLGYVAGQIGLAGRARVARAFWSFASPHEAVDLFPHAVLLALGVTIFAAYAPRKRRTWAIVMAALLAIGLPLRLLAESAYVTHEWSNLEKVSHLALLAATLGLTWLLLATVPEAEQPRLRPAFLIVVALGSAVAIALSAGLVYGELCGVVAAAVSGAWVAAHPRGPSGASGVLTCSLGSLIVLAHFYAQLTPTNATMLLISLVFAGGRLPHVVSTWQPWQQLAVRGGLWLVPLIFAVVSSALTAQTATSAGPYAV
jgi:hypothetical protein